VSAPPRIPSEGLTQDALPERERFRYVLTRTLATIRPLWPWLIVGAIAWLGWHELKQIDLMAVRRMLRDTDVDLVLYLLVATAVNLAVFGFYDVVALGPLSQPPAATARWKVGVLSFAWSNFLTLGPLAGPALRLWLYRPLDVTGERARSALSIIIVALGLALGAWCGAAWLPLPAALDTFPVHLILILPMGALMVGALRGVRHVPWLPAVIRRWEGRPLALGTVALLDWLLAWVVFHLAIDALRGEISLSVSLALFFAGQLIGLASFVPGGLGTADAFWLVALGGISGGHDRILAALVLYRLIYYVLPWACATLVLAGRLVRTGSRTGAFLRTAVASYTVLCGVALLASAATPALSDRIVFLKKSVPLALVEISHSVSVVLGFLLLVVARGLARGYRSSHRLALALFFAGALTTFLKGLDFEEATLSLAAVAMLLVFHRSFGRVGRLRPPLEFLVSVGVFAVVLFAAIGFGSGPSVFETPAIFSRFSYRGDEARFVRGLGILTTLAAIVAVHLGQRSKARDLLPGPGEIDRSLAEVRAYARGSDALLVACGDKAIFRPAGTEGAPSGGFIAYRSAGRFLVAYSDPVGPPGSARDLLTAFLDFAAGLDRDVILYQISTDFLPVAHDFGFSFFKLGEEAIVDLRQFDLKGNKAKSWRNAINNVERAGGRFEIVAGDDLRSLLPELRQVSDDWLADKHMVEKRFSVGRFDENYLMRFPCALVRDDAGRVAGFANLLEGPRGEELSVDLMRYSGRREQTGGLRGVMDYLFLNLMLHGRERGFARFSLGMAPLAAVGQERWARPVERLAHFFSRHGEHWYNYQGLRLYKEKFDPTWEPRYMAYPRPWDWPIASTATAALIAGGWRGLLISKGAGG
jgi:phosphatidylglycerol lysyltransferase